MATMLPGFKFTGTIANISAYMRRGSDKIVLRAKGGPSKNKIKRHPNFANLRRNNTEFGGRSAASREIMSMLQPQKALADYNIAPILNKLLVPVQRLDTTSAYGERHIRLSHQPQILEGLDFNRTNPFSSIIRSPLIWSLSKTSVTSGISIPALLPGINFFVPGKYPLFSLLATVCTVRDVLWQDKSYATAPGVCQGFDMVSTPWLPCSNGSASLTLDLAIRTSSTSNDLPPGNEWSMMLCIGICFGTIGNDGNPQQVKYTGAAKVLGMK